MVENKEEQDFYMTNPQGELDVTIGENIILYINTPTKLYKNMASVVSEHNIAYVSMNIPNVKEFNSVVKKNLPIELGEKGPSVIARVDHPFGSNDIVSRIAGIIAAKENGANAVDIMMPTQYIVDSNMSALLADIKEVYDNTHKKPIKTWYTIDVGHPSLNKDKIISICKILKANKVKYISTASGYYNNKLSFADQVILSRLIKKETGAMIKTFVECENSEVAQNIFKSGINLIEIPYTPTIGWIYDIKKPSKEDILKNSTTNSSDEQPPQTI